MISADSISSHSKDRHVFLISYKLVIKNCAQKLRTMKESVKSKTEGKRRHGLPFPKGLHASVLKGRREDAPQVEWWSEHVSPSVSSLQPNKDKRTDGSPVAFSSLALERKETRERRWNQERQQLEARKGRRQASFDPKKDSDAREKALFFIVDNCGARLSLGAWSHPRSFLPWPKIT